MGQSYVQTVQMPENWLEYLWNIISVGAFSCAASGKGEGANCRLDGPLGAPGEGLLWKAVPSTQSLGCWALAIVGHLTLLCRGSERLGDSLVDTQITREIRPMPAVLYLREKAKARHRPTPVRSPLTCLLVRGSPRPPPTLPWLL